MKKPVILFIQGGGEGAYKIDESLVLFMREALKDEYIIDYPRMPDEGNPSYETYKVKIDEELKKIDARVILVGHSVGSCILLKYLSETRTDQEIAGIFLIATPFWGNGGWEYEGFSLENDFASKLPKKVPIFLYHGTDDEIVPFAHLGLYAREIPGARICEIAGRGHQLDNDLTEVVRDIKRLDQ